MRMHSARTGQMSPSLSELVGPARFERLRVAIDNLDFQVGAELLRETLSVGMRTIGRERQTSCAVTSI